jgi:phage-related protein
LVDIHGVSSAFNAFGLESDQVSGAMDHLFRVSQATGIGMNDLAAQVSSNAPAVQQLGFSFEETAALVGNLDRAGLNSSRMMMGMSQSLVRLARDGEEPAEAFRRTVDEIDAFLAAGDQAAAIDLAGEVFGTRNATQFIGAIQDGTLAMDDLASVAGMTEDTILGAGEETMDFAEQWQLFKNNVLVVLEPIASRVFSAFGDGMAWLTESAFPALSSAWDSYVSPVLSWIGDMWDEYIGPALTSLGDTLTNVIVPALVEFGDRAQTMWTEYVEPTFMGIWGVIQDYVIPTIRELWQDVIKPAFTEIGETIQAWWDNVGRPIFNKVEDIIINKVGPAITGLWQNVVGPAFAGIGDFISSAWNNVIKPIFDTIQSILNGDLTGAFNSFKDAVTGVFETVGGVISDIWNATIKPVWQAMSSFISDTVVPGVETGVDFLRRAFDRVANFFRTPINWVIRYVWNAGLRKAYNAVAGVIGASQLERADEIGEFGGTPASAPVQRGSTTRGLAPRAFARGGYASPGWALVGEEGPELIDLTTPGRVYTAGQTAEALAALDAGRDLTDQQSQILAGPSPARALAPMGGPGDWVSDAWGAVTDAAGAALRWTRGALASAADALLGPIFEGIAGRMAEHGRFGELAGSAMVNVKDRLMDWIRGQDEEYLARTMSGVDKFDPAMLGAGVAGAGAGGGWLRPGPGPVTSRFGPRWGGMHAGIDLAMPVGTQLRAPFDGQVIRSGFGTLAGRTGLGLMMMLANGFGAYFGHLSRVFAADGQAFNRGDILALSGNTGNSTGPHLHFEVNRGNFQAPINPTMTGLFDQGGILEHGHAALNLSGEPEAILTGDQWRQLEAIANGEAQWPAYATGPAAVVTVENGDAGRVVGAIDFAMKARERGVRARSRG